VGAGGHPPGGPVAIPRTREPQPVARHRQAEVSRGQEGQW